MNRSQRRITTPNRSKYMHQINNYYYQSGDVEKKVAPKFIIAALVFMLVGIGLGYFAYPFLSPTNWVSAEQVDAQAIPTTEQVLSSIGPEQIAAFVNAHKDQFPSLIKEAPKPTPTPIPTKTPEQIQKEADDATVDVMVNKGEFRIFKISYLPQYYSLIKEAGEVDFGDSNSKRIQGLKAKYMGDTIYLNWKLKDGTEADAMLYPDGRVHWRAGHGYDMLNVERAIQLIVDVTRRDSCAGKQ